MLSSPASRSDAVEVGRAMVEACGRGGGDAHCIAEGRKAVTDGQVTASPSQRATLS